MEWTVPKLEGYKKRLWIAGAFSFVICMILSMYFHHFDSAHWMFTVDSIESGNGVYELNGFYYPPLYGYILSFLAMVADILAIPMIAVFPTDTSVPAGMGSYMYYNPAFPILYKCVDALASIAIAVLLFDLVKDYTGNERTAYRMSLIWLICPIVIHMTAIQGQFDVLAIMTGLMCLSALRKENYFLAGALFAISVLLKVFMGPCIVAFVIYIWAKKGKNLGSMRYVAYAAIGALIVTVITYIPLFADGTWQYSITFFSDRAGRVWYMTLITMLGILPMLGMMILCAYHMIEDTEDNERNLIVWTALLFGMAASIAPGYQYGPWISACIILMWTVMDDKRLYNKLYWCTALASTLTAITITHFYQMMMGSYFWGFPDYVNVAELALAANPVMSVVATIISIIYVLALILAMVITLMSLFEGRWDVLDSISERIRSTEGER